MRGLGLSFGHIRIFPPKTSKKKLGCSPSYNHKLLMRPHRYCCHSDVITCTSSAPLLASPAPDVACGAALLLLCISMRVLRPRMSNNSTSPPAVCWSKGSSASRPTGLLPCCTGINNPAS